MVRKEWCGGPESNRHVPCGTRDFKSLLNIRKLLNIQHLKFESLKLCKQLCKFQGFPGSIAVSIVLSFSQEDSLSCLPAGAPRRV